MIKRNSADNTPDIRSRVRPALVESTANGTE
jgi:hypothetical protein